MGLKRRIILTLLLLFAAIFAMIAIVYHILKLWAARDKLLFYNHVVLGGVTFLCLFCGTCIIFDLSDEPVSRFQSLLMFTCIQGLMVVLLLISVLALGMRWATSDPLDLGNDEDDEPFSDEDKTHLTMIIAFSCTAAIPLIVFVVCSGLYLSRSRGELYEDYD